MDGQLYYGKSGYAGEFGHMPIFDNEFVCRCGKKKGRLETQASGWALECMFREKLLEGSSSLITSKVTSDEEITMEDIIEAAIADDVLAIELSQIGENLGRGVASLINVFNPERVILGGSLMQTGEYIWLPIKTAINK